MSTVTYYFDNYDVSVAWQYFSGDACDNDTGTAGYTTLDSDILLLNSNSCAGTNLGAISKVEIRGSISYGNVVDTDSIDFIPYFGGASDGDTHNEVCDVYGATWTDYIDITSDTNAPGTWDWDDVQDLDCKLVSNIASPGGSEFVLSYVTEIRVTYTENDNLTATSFVSGTPAIGSPDLAVVIDELTATSIVGNAPIIEEPTAGHDTTNELTATSIVGGTPVIGEPTIEHDSTNELIADSISTRNVVFGSPIIDDGTDQPFSALTLAIDSIGDSLSSFSDPVSDSLIQTNNLVDDCLILYDDS